MGAKQLLEEQGAKVKAIELGPEWLPGLLSAEGAAIRAELGAMTGQTSMPHVFIAEGGQVSADAQRCRRRLTNPGQSISTMSVSLGRLVVPSQAACLDAIRARRKTEKADPAVRSRRREDRDTDASPLFKKKSEVFRRSWTDR